MRRFLLLFSSLLLTLTAFSQNTTVWPFVDQAIIPSPSPDMPAYATFLYADVVDLQAVEDAFAAHYETHGWQHLHEDLEHNPYTRFYYQWYREAPNYADAEGRVRKMTTSELIHWRSDRIKEAPKTTSSSMERSSTTWSFLGPKRTLWREDHNSAQPTAPWQVNIYAMAAAPSNPAVLYAGSETGALYKSSDKGLNWTAFNDFNFGRAILSVAIHPNNPDTVYVATSTDIMKTTDGGGSWAVIHTQAGMSCNSLAISPSTPSTLFAGTANGLQKSTDSGANWSTVLTPHIDDIVYRPGDGTTLYALARTGSPDTYSFYKSTDSGVNFNLSMSGWPSVNEHSGGRLSVTPANPDYVWALLLTQDANGNEQKPYLLKSTDQAATWTTASIGGENGFSLNNGQGYYDLDVVASHTNPDHVIAATTTAYRTVDGGTTWTAIGGYTGPFAIHPDIQDMICIMDGTEENTWIATDGGINFSTDFYGNTSNWEARIDGLDGTDFWGFAQGWNEDYIIGGRYHNGNTAIHENYPDKRALRLGGAESVTGWAMHGRERHAAFDDIAELIIPDQIDEAPEGSFLFTKHPQNYYYGDAFSRVMIDLEDMLTAYLGEGNSFWRSQDGGGSWEALFTFPGKPYHFDISRADGDYIYLTSDAGFYRSTDRGLSFTQMTLPPGMSNWNAQNFRVAASSADKDVVWVLNHRSGATSSAGRVFRSDNGGATWTDLTTAALASRKWAAIAHQAGTNGGIYIASRRGDAGTLPAKVMYRDNSMSDWVDYSAGLPQSANPIKLLPFYRDDKLRWGGNRGAWEVDLYETNWTPMAQAFVSGKYQICDRDTVEFDSYSVAKGSATFSWSIPGASWTSGLNAREVKAIFPDTGTYTATLTLNQDGVISTSAVNVKIGAECNADQFPGNAMTLSGASTDYAATREALGLTSNTMTFSCWIKRDGAQNPYSGIIFMRAGTASGLNFGTNNELRFHWNDDQWWWNSGLVVPDNEWTHVAMVVTTTDITLYMNGVPAVNTTNPAPTFFDGPMYFGADPNWSARRFKGLMDEVLIYNRAFTQAEIRELMHLTRVPANETDLIGYWQFNRSAGIITDRVGSNHASLVGGASRMTSTVPVGPGESFRHTVTAGGTYSFGTTGLELTFPGGGTTFPNGELCVTRIDHAPDQIPAPMVSPPYWVVHNYGTNATFDELVSLDFDSIGPVSAAQAADPESIALFKRGSTADGLTWNDPVDLAESAVAGTNGSALFSDGNGQTSFSQYIIALQSAVVAADLFGFTAWLNNDQEVEIRWESLREDQVDYYIVQRSQDGRVFEDLGLVDAVGNSQAPQAYAALDVDPLRGLSYYRLKTVDLDGSFAYSAVRSILLDAPTDKVVLYPNPLPSGTRLEVKSIFTEPVHVLLFTAKGKLVRQFTVKGEASLDLSELPTGVYGYLLQTTRWKKGGRIVVE